MNRIMDMDPSEDLIDGMTLVAALCGPVVIGLMGRVRARKTLGCPVCAAYAEVSDVLAANGLVDFAGAGLGLPPSVAAGIADAADQQFHQSRPLLLDALYSAGDIDADTWKHEHRRTRMAQ